MFQKQNISKLFLIAVFCAAGFGAAGEANAILIWDGSFTSSTVWTGKFIDWNPWDYPCMNSGGVALVKTDSMGRPGKYATKIIANVPNSCFGIEGNPADSSTMRVELEHYDINETEGKDYYYGFSFYLAPGFVIHDTEWKNIAQWAVNKRTDGGVNPPAQLTLESNALDLAVCGKSTPMITSPKEFCSTATGTKRLFNLIPAASLTTGKWYDVVIRIKWSRTSGLVQAWWQSPSKPYGVPTISESGKPTYYADEGTNFRGLGNYRGAGVVTHAYDEDVYYVMDYKVGTTFDDVKYGGTSTPPPAHCSNGVKDADETDIDCGGVDCAPCAVPPPPDTEKPTVSITCPTDGATYDTLVTTVSGTATDNVGVKEVWVKVGTGGAWQKATLTSPDAASTDWSISGLTGIVVGANTIYAKSIDTSDNDSIPTGSVESDVLINVTISAGFVPAAPGGTLLFDGTVDSSSYFLDNTPVAGMGGLINPNYDFYDQWYCIPQLDSFAIVDASTLPGGRSGYVIKAKAQPILSDCGGNQHVVVATGISGLPSGAYTDVWYSWSTMLDPSFQPVGGSGNYRHFGFFIEPAGNLFTPNTGLYMDMDDPSSLAVTVYNTGWASNPVLSAADHTKGVWHDWLYHVKWAADNTGYYEVFHKSGSETDYALKFSEHGVNTISSDMSNPANLNDHQNRVGIYRSSATLPTDIIYIKGLKIGTTMASVTSGSSSSSNPAPTCAASAAPPAPPDPCGNGIKDAGEFCEKTTNEGCSSSSICNSDCTACVVPPPPPPICYGVVCSTPGYCQKGPGRCIEIAGEPVCTYYYDSNPCEDNDGNPCKMGRCSSSDGGITGFCDKAKSDVVCSAPGFCQAGIGQCVATSLTDYICSYNDNPDPCDLDDNECTLDVCKSMDGNFSSSCIATNLDACEGIVPCGRTIDNPKTSWNETAPCEFCHLVLILNRVTNFLMELVAVVSLLSIIITGLLFITSAGNPEIKNKAKTALKWIIAGLIIVFLAWLLIDFLLSAWGYLDPLGGKWSVIC